MCIVLACLGVARCVIIQVACCSHVGAESLFVLFWCVWPRVSAPSAIGASLVALWWTHLAHVQAVASGAVSSHK